jgi:hypothetical protein
MPRRFDPQEFFARWEISTAAKCLYIATLLNKRVYLI